MMRLLNLKTSHLLRRSLSSERKRLPTGSRSGESNPNQEAELFIRALTSLRHSGGGIDSPQALAALAALQHSAAVTTNVPSQPLATLEGIERHNGPNAAASSSLLVWSLAKIQLLRFFKQVRSAAMEKLDDYSDEELNHLVMTLGAARIKDDELLNALSKQIVARLEAISVDDDAHGHTGRLPPTALSLSTIAMAFVMNQTLDKQVFDAIASYACHLHETSLRRPSHELISDRELLSLAWSFVASRTLDKSTLTPNVKAFFELSAPGARTPSSPKLFDVSPPEQLHEACLAYRMTVSPVLPPLLQSLITPDWFNKFKERCEDFIAQPAKLRASSKRNYLLDIVDYLESRGHRGYKHNFITPRGLFADLLVGGRTIVQFLTNKDDILNDRKTSTGLKRFRGKLLTMEGFRVIELNQNDWTKLTVGDRHKLIDHIVQAAVGDRR